MIPSDHDSSFCAQLQRGFPAWEEVENANVGASRTCCCGLSRQLETTSNADGIRAREVLCKAARAAAMLSHMLARQALAVKGSGGCPGM